MGGRGQQCSRFVSCQQNERLLLTKICTIEVSSSVYRLLVLEIVLIQQS